METYYLETNSPTELSQKQGSFDLEVKKRVIKRFQLNKSMYETVGAPWSWQDRLAWTDQQWKNYVNAPELHTWIAYDGEIPAGYFELQKQALDWVEIAYFGLAPAYIGKGYGGFLLSAAIKSAWELGASKVWVHTCTLDHPSALMNYQARGMKIFNTETSS